MINDHSATSPGASTYLGASSTLIGAAPSWLVRLILLGNRLTPGGINRLIALTRDDRFRRNLVIVGCSGEGRLTTPKPDGAEVKTVLKISLQSVGSVGYGFRKL